MPDYNQREKDEMLSTLDDTVQNAIPVVVNKIIDARVDTAVKFSNLFHSTVEVTLQQRIGWFRWKNSETHFLVASSRNHFEHFFNENDNTHVEN